MISLSLNQLLKATAPLPTALLSMALEKKTFSWQVWGSMAVVIGGSALAAAGEVTAGRLDEFILGFLLCLGSVLAAAGWGVLSAMLLQGGGPDDRLDAVTLVFYSSPYSVLVLLVIFFIKGEFSALVTELESDSSESMNGVTILLIILGGGLLGFSYDLIHNQFVRMTSSMTMAVMGNSKLVLLIVLSMVWLDPPAHVDWLTAVNILGVVIGIAGCIWYSWSRYAAALTRCYPSTSHAHARARTACLSSPICTALRRRLAEQQKPAPLLSAKPDALTKGRSAGEATQLLEGSEGSTTCCVVS